MALAILLLLAACYLRAYLRSGVPWLSCPLFSLSFYPQRSLGCLFDLPQIIKDTILKQTDQQGVS